MAGVHLLLVALLCLAVSTAQPPEPLRITPAVIGAGSGPRACPADDLLNAARMNASDSARLAIQNSPCGGIGWAQIVNIDMTDASQMCPTPWTLYNAPQRSCSIPNVGCIGVTFPVPTGTYTRVCGRALGVETGTPDGFFRDGNVGSLDVNYLDGISVTYGAPRQHIWSFVAGHGPEFGQQNIRCPCENPNRIVAPLPDYVGNNYFCEGDYNGLLWDGMDCSTVQCCNFNNPPYFTVTLPAPTSDSVEVRICANQARGDEAVNLVQMQLYVQ